LLPFQAEAARQGTNPGHLPPMPLPATEKVHYELARRDA
jgi:hypothetical protein